MRMTNWRGAILVAIVGMALAACGNGVSVDAASTPSPPGSPTPNDTPTISGTPPTSITAGTNYTFQPSATDGNGDALTFSAAGLPAWAAIDAKTGAVSGVPAKTDVGTTVGIVISVTDGQASATLPAFSITVNAAPDNAPVISGTPATSVVAGSAYSFTPSASDPDGNPLTFSITNKPSWASFSTATGALTGTPTASQVGTFSNILISVSDGTLSQALPTFSITVNAVANHAPVISGSPATTVVAGNLYSFTPTASDAPGNMLTFSITGKPSWATFSTVTGALTGTPTTAQVGPYPNIVIGVSDGTASQALPAFTITVSAAPVHAPIISGTPATSVVAGSAYSFTPTASDAPGNTLTFSITGKPAWAAFSSANGALTGTPTTAQVGTYASITISVSDGTASKSLPAFTITVSPPTVHAPVISGTPATSVVAGSAYSFTPTASDAPGNTLTFSITAKPSWATFSAATGALTGTPTTVQVGTYPNIVISVSDGTASQALAAFTITVTQATGTAALTWSLPTQNTDGSSLTDLAGFKIYHGTSATSLTDIVQLQGATTTTYTFSGLVSGTHYFAITSLNSASVESPMTAVASKAIP